MARRTQTAAARPAPVAAKAFWQDEYDPVAEPECNDVKKWILLMGLALTYATSAHAALDVGDAAPNFTADAAQGGKVFRFSLAESLKKGPVVLYFFPAAFSEGCSVEAHQFAEAIDKFQALGATVIGVSGDDIDTLGKFSVQACQSKFAVASDTAQTIMRSYDAVMTLRPEYANRVSYVIAPGGAVVYNYQSLDPNRHVEKTLAAVRDWKGIKR